MNEQEKEFKKMEEKLDDWIDTELKKEKYWNNKEIHNEEERLEVIKKRDRAMFEGTKWEEDIDWLIEQAEDKQRIMPVIDGVGKLNEYLHHHSLLAKRRWGDSITQIAIDDMAWMNNRIKELEEHLIEIIGMRNLPDEVLKIAEEALEGKE